MKTIRFIAPLTAILFVPATWGASVIWDGPTIPFAKPSSADWTQPANQDRITPLVWLTRADTQGLLNIQSEPAYTHNLSPAGTEWAYGTTASFSSLTYKNWEAWTGNNPPGTVGQNAVVHLIGEDIYIDIKFTSWAGAGAGGGFSYVRSTAPVPEPGSLALLGTGAFLLSSRRRR